MRELNKLVMCKLDWKLLTADIYSDINNYQISLLIKVCANKHFLTGGNMPCVALFNKT